MSRLTLLLLISTLLALVCAKTIHLSSPNSKHHIGTTVPNISPHLAEISAPRIAKPPHPELGKRRHHHKHSSSAYIPNGKITYYYGSQLLNPACPGAQTPTDGSMTAAISFDSPFQCGDRIRIQGQGGKSVVVTAVDRCAACTRNWIDVTKGVFKHFAGLETGVLNDLRLSKE